MDFQINKVVRPGSLGRYAVVEIILAVILAVAELSVMRGEVTVPAVVVGMLTVGLVAVAPRFPVTASLLSLLLVLSPFVLGDVAPVFSMFFSALIVEIVVARGQLAVGLFLVIAQWALSTVDATTGVLFTDPVALAAVTFILLTAYAAGWFRHNHRRRQEDLRRELALQEQRQRTELARDLHDSVATSLTSVVMQAQALNLATPQSEESSYRQGLDNISDSARDALTHLRTMLRLLNEEPGNQEFRLRADGPPLSVTLEKAVRELEAHDMTVNVRVSVPPNAQVDRDTVAKVLTEMTSNAAKHSPRGSMVALVCGAEGDNVTLSMVNPVRDASSFPDGDDMSGGLGLGSMHARARKADGELVAGIITDDESSCGRSVHSAGPPESRRPVWRTTLRLPIIVTES